MDCINCGISSARSNAIAMHLLENGTIRCVIQQWTAPLTVSHTDHLCDACLNLANNALKNDNLGDDLPTLSHQRVSIYCGHSVLRIRSHTLRTDSEHEQRIHQAIEEWIMPRSVSYCIL